jgi:hypothetical protein
MPLSEPTTLVSDWVLAALAIALGSRLYRAGSGTAKQKQAQRLWAFGFLAGAAAALAGGIVHGFAASLSPFAHAVLWKTVLAACGLAGSLLLAGTVRATVDGSWRTLFLAAAAAQLAAYLVLVSGSNATGLAVWNGAATIVVLLALALATAGSDPRRLAWILLGLGLSAAGLVAQRAGVGASILNHNDVCHGLQAVSLWPFYRAGLRLQPACSPSGA